MPVTGKHFRNLRLTSNLVSIIMLFLVFIFLLLSLELFKKIIKKHCIRKSWHKFPILRVRISETKTMYTHAFYLKMAPKKIVFSWAETRGLVQKFHRFHLVLFVSISFTFWAMGNIFTCALFPNCVFFFCFCFVRINFCPKYLVL